MLKNKITAVLVLLLASACMMYAQEPQTPSPEQMAEKEAERLGTILNLEDWQIFYVDSTLNYNYTHLVAELEQMRRSKVENSDLYYDVQDRWMEATEAAYKKYFTPQQWQSYLKQGGQRIIADRERRRAKAAGLKPENTKATKSEKKKKK